MSEVAFGLASSASTVFLFYPYRDFVKHYPTAANADFFVSRYRGLATNPSQLGLLALPNALMLSVGGRGDAAGIAAGSLLAGFTRRFTRTLIYRLGERTGSRAGVSVYNGSWDAVAKATASYGAMSWFVGGTAVALTQLLTSGLAIASVGGVSRGGGRRHNRRDPTQAFLLDWWYMFRAHAFFTMISAPVRNALSSAMHIPTRGGAQIGLAQWGASEMHIYKEAALVSKRMMQDMGLRYFFQGTIRSALKVSLPFGFNYALYKGMINAAQRSDGRR